VKKNGHLAAINDMKKDKEITYILCKSYGDFKSYLKKHKLPFDLTQYRPISSVGDSCGLDLTDARILVSPHFFLMDDLNEFINECLIYTFRHR
jgi:hypothetical protein